MEPNEVTFTFNLEFTVSIPFATLPVTKPDLGPHITCPKYGTCRSSCTSDCAPKSFGEMMDRRSDYNIREFRRKKDPWRIGLLEAMENG